MPGDSSAANAIHAEGLRKAFGSTQALDGVDLIVPRGIVYGLLGPNGAGKSTVVRILSTLLRPDSGSATVDGIDVLRDPGAVRRHIGLAGQYAAVDEYLTGRENLMMFARLSGLGKAVARERAAELLERFDLVDAADRPSKGYSGGMRRRLDLAASLASRPPVLFLDEPTTGLDPRSRTDLWDVIRDRVAEGTTVLLTTQYLEEADQLADEIVVIDHGQAIARGTAETLKRRVGGEHLDVTVTDTAQWDLAEQVMAGVATGPLRLHRIEGELSAPVASGVEALGHVMRALQDAGVGIADIGLRRPTLDDVFMELTGHEAGQATTDTADDSVSTPAGAS